MKLSHYEWDPDLDLIAEGGFAEVFKAKDLHTENRFVALKIYKEAVSRGTKGSTGQKKYSLEQEFAKVDGLSHTHLVSYYGLDYLQHKDAMGRTASYPVLIMEYAGEGTLNDVIDKDLSLEVKQKILLEIAQAIGYLHKQGIIHRDLKPGNILFSKDRTHKRVAKVTDFGISQDTLTDNTIQQSFTEGVGTPHYMAPEQFYKRKFGLDGEVSERTDIWALGVIMYKMFTGKLPFGDGEKDYESIRDQIVEQEPDYSAIPKEYSMAVQNCLRKKASERYSSIQEMVQDLNQQKADRTTVLQTGSWENTENIPQKKSRIWISMSVLALVFLLGFGGYYFYRTATIKSLLAQGWDSYKTINYKDAYDAYLKASEYDSGEAYYFLSVFNMFGYGTEINYDKANELTNKAIDVGYDMANFQLGWSYQNELGVAKDTVKAKEYYKKSLESIQKLSDEGHPEAQNLHGILYLNGFAVEKNIEKAKQFYAMAEKQEHLAAIENLASLNRIAKNYKEAFEGYEKCMKVGRFSCYRGLADMYRMGWHVQKDSVRALELYTIAANNKDVQSQYLLGNFYLNGTMVAQKDKIKAVGWYTKAAERGHLNAQNELGTIYYQEKNYKEAEKWFLKAAEKGNAYAAYNLGLIYQGGLDQNKDYTGAKKWFMVAAKKGHAPAQYRLGMLYENGDGVEKDTSKAKDWYLSAAEQKYTLAEYALGQLAYNTGEKGYVAAREWYTKAAESDDAKAQYKIGFMYERGQGGSKDLLKARKMYERSAAQNNKEALYAMGNIYYNGLWGTGKDEKKAKALYLKSANQGYAYAQYMTGFIYYMKKYYYLAKPWFEKAAVQNHAQAQNYLGILYDQGKTGPKNYEKALEFFRKAADNGNQYGKYNVGIYHFYGYGIPKDRMKARMWFNASCNDGYNKACTKLKSDY